MTQAPEFLSAHFMPPSVDDLPIPLHPYYVIGGKRRYIHKRMHFGRVIVPVEDQPTIPELAEDADAFLWLDMPKIPAALIGKVWSFFRQVNIEKDSEAMVDLTYHAVPCDDDRSCFAGYHAFIPPQTATGGGVQCVRNPGHYRRGFQLVGTLHSHCDFGAFHSGTDTHDADGHDGIHFTIGHVDKNPAEIAIMASANGKRWEKIDLADVVEGEVVYQSAPAWWMRYVEHPLAIEEFKNKGFGYGKKTTAITTYEEMDEWNEQMGLGWGTRNHSGVHTGIYRPKVDVTMPTLWGQHWRMRTLIERMIEARKFHGDMENETDLVLNATMLAEELDRLKDDAADMGIVIEFEFRYRSPTITTVKTTTPLITTGGSRK